MRKMPEISCSSDLLWSDPIDERTSHGLDEATLMEWKDVEFVRNDERGTLFSDLQLHLHLRLHLHLHLEIQKQVDICSGAGFVFGHKAIVDFLGNNNLCSIVRLIWYLHICNQYRAHDVQREGYNEHFMHSGRDLPLVVTVFSAPNYCGYYGNLAAILRYAHVFSNC